ncbi:uncharacterized protein LOC131434075 [Malaya genurostris]|uniref:uncharacterized protein LOC131434075 n=1 Tax=Malaya genurostris TaxID=325434 RepID=UPI0026F3E9DD|nr:uncharacterized protein LOC131434075 [Malaya genurostris]
MCPPIASRVVVFVVVVFSILTILTSSQAATIDPRNHDFVFPVLDEKTLGDLCEVSYGQGQFALVGTCQRVRDCGTFAQRLRTEKRFDVLKELCYFEVHDPVVCCLSEQNAGIRIGGGLDDGFPPVVGPKSVLDREWPFDDGDEKANLV